VLLWFVGTSVATVWMVFRDPRFDYRPLILGSLLPDAVDVWTGGSWAMHSVLVSMAGVILVMLVTIGRRRMRRLLLAVPIGMLLHLVFDGAFADADVFWWPLGGVAPGAPLPVIARGWWNVVLEAAGAAIVIGGMRRFRLRDTGPWHTFWGTGRLEVPDRLEKRS
jgi:hypothetical protein